MAITLFGYTLNRRAKETDNDKTVSFAPETPDDGAVTITAAGGAYGTYFDMDGSARTEAELITKYRQVALDQEVEFAIDQIVNEAMAFDENELVALNLDNLKGYSATIKNRIIAEFKEILEIMNFKDIGPKLFRRWYIDGRTYHHVIIDEERPEEGIKELRYIDPRKIRKVREVETKMENGVPIRRTKNEYYVFNDRGFGQANSVTSFGTITVSSSEVAKGLKIAADSIVYCPSGLMNENNTIVLSYLHKAIRVLNQLRAMEDALVIYRLSRAPERRIFTVDVGGMPKMKAEQHVQNLMTRHRNKLVYDSRTGEIRDDRKVQTMLEDYWLPTRDGRGTKIDVLPGGQNLGQLEDVEYFQKKLWRALNIPWSRFEQQGGFMASKTTEITRDEIDFFKFIVTIRKQFCGIFDGALKQQLLLKQVISEDEWPKIRAALEYEFAQDNHFTELKFLDTMSARLGILQQASPYIGSVFSQEYVKRKIMGFTEQEIKEIDQQIAKEPPPTGAMGPEQPQLPQGQQPEEEEEDPDEHHTFTEI